MSQNELSINRAAKKKKIAVWNRKLAWITLFILVAMNISVYADYYEWVTWLKLTGIISSTIFTLLLLIHSGFSVYLFGFPKFKWKIRVVHIYIGYFLFVFRNLLRISKRSKKQHQYYIDCFLHLKGI